MTVTIILPCKDSSAMVTARNSKMVDLEVELVCHIFCQHLAELFNFQMGRYVLCVCVCVVNIWSLRWPYGFTTFGPIHLHDFSLFTFNKLSLHLGACFSGAVGGLGF